MNNKMIFFILLLGVISFAPVKMHAQTKSEWQPIFLLVTGGNTMDGVEASFQINTCKGEDVVFVKFINHNAYPVKLEWFDAVFTQEQKWVNEERVSAKKSLTLPANSEAKGECANNSYPILLVKVKDFVPSKKDVKRYSTSQLKVIAVQ
jgi:hypothetical protein